MGCDVYGRLFWKCVNFNYGIKSEVHLMVLMDEW